MTDPFDIDLYAAEYVLGTLSQTERAEATVLRATNATMNVAVMDWESRLVPLNESTSSATPSVGLFTKIERRIDALSTTSGRAVRQWRALAVAASIAFIIASSTAIYELRTHASSPDNVAILQSATSVAGFVATFDATNATLDVRTVAAPPADHKDYELWLIADGSTVPHSLGVLPTLDLKSIKLGPAVAHALHHATLAVSIEPPGGSPTGVPTGPVVFTGKLL